MRIYKEGFTLIELMVVIVIIGILAAIAIPNYIRIVNQAKEAEVKANMHTIQLEVEYYCIESPAHNYPETSARISGELPAGLKNPFTLGGLVVQDEPADVAGAVEYDTRDPYDSYTIAGLGKNAVPINLILSPGCVY
jgi:prepilin-type N-terminal cleavage/methylation domain-containing protein